MRASRRPVALRRRPGKTDRGHEPRNCAAPARARASAGSRACRRGHAGGGPPCRQGSTLASLNPPMSLRMVVAFQIQKAERSHAGLRFHPPPRTTRTEHAASSMAVPSVGARLNGSRALVGTPLRVARPAAHREASGPDRHHLRALGAIREHGARSPLRSLRCWRRRLQTRRCGLRLGARSGAVLNLCAAGRTGSGAPLPCTAAEDTAARVSRQTGRQHGSAAPSAPTPARRSGGGRPGWCARR